MTGLRWVAGSALLDGICMGLFGIISGDEDLTVPGFAMAFLAIGPFLLSYVKRIV